VKKSKSKAPPSDSRQRLAGMIAARAELVAKVDALQAAALKLEGAMTAAGPLEAKLASLDSMESAEMSAWAKAGADGAAPKADTKAREALNKSIATARAGAVAATSAYSSITGEHADTSRAIADLAVPMDIEVAAIIAESCESLMSAFDSDNRRLAAKAVQLRQAHEMVLAALDKVRRTEPGRPLALALEALDGKLRRLFTVPAQDDDAASRSLAAWRAFSDGLRNNANLKLDAKARDSAPAPEPDIGQIILKRNAALAAKGK